MGSALLLGTGSVIAHEIDLDSREAAERVAVPYALETLGTTGSAELTVDRIDYYGLASPVASAIFDDGAGNASSAGLSLTVNANRRILASENAYIRVTLADGLVFNTAATVSGADGALVSGGVEKSFIVYKLGATALDADITVTIDGGLSVVRAAGLYSATITAHNDPDDATDGLNARSTLFAGSGPIVNIVSGLDVRVVAGLPAVSDVNTGFLWFVGPKRRSTQCCSGKLGLVQCRGKAVYRGYKSARCG